MKYSNHKTFRSGKLGGIGKRASPLWLIANLRSVSASGHQGEHPPFIDQRQVLDESEVISATCFSSSHVHVKKAIETIPKSTTF